MKPAQRQWFVASSFTDPESGSLVHRDSRLVTLITFLRVLGQQMGLALLPLLIFISGKYEKICIMSSSFSLPASTHTHKYKTGQNKAGAQNRTWQCKDLEWQGQDTGGEGWCTVSRTRLGRALSLEQLVQVQEGVVAKAQEISQVVCKTRQQLLHYRKPAQATPADMV
eukprot:gene5314-18559_t